MMIWSAVLALLFGAWCNGCLAQICLVGDGMVPELHLRHSRRRNLLPALSLLRGGIVARESAFLSCFCTALGGFKAAPSCPCVVKLG